MNAFMAGLLSAVWPAANGPRKEARIEGFIRKPIPKKEQVIEPKEIEKPAEINNDSVVIDKDKNEHTPPPVEENTPAVKIDTTGMLGTHVKSLQLAAARHTDNNDHHRLRLSSRRKGGIKPAGKKPLW